MIIHVLLQCGRIEEIEQLDKKQKEFMVTINKKKTRMVSLQECDDDELLNNDCSKLMLVQPNKGLFFIDEQPKLQSHYFLESLRQTKLFPQQMFCAYYAGQIGQSNVAIIEYSLPLQDYILDDEEDPNQEDWYKFNKLYKIALISKKVLSNVLKMLGLEPLCHYQEDQAKRFKKMMRNLKQVHIKQRNLGLDSDETNSQKNHSQSQKQDINSSNQNSPQELPQNQKATDNSEIDNEFVEDESLTKKPLFCDAKMFVKKKKYIPDLDIKHIGIRQDINIRLSSPEQVAENIIFRNGHYVEDLDSGALDEYIQKQNVHELLISMKEGKNQFDEFYNFFVIRQFFHFFQKLLHLKIFGQSTHFFDCFQDKKYFVEHSRCPVFVQNILEQNDEIDKMTLLYLVIDYPFIEVDKVVTNLNLFLDELAIFSKNKIEKKIKQIKADLTGEVEQEAEQTQKPEQDLQNDNVETNEQKQIKRILKQIKEPQYQEQSQFEIRGSYI